MKTPVDREDQPLSAYLLKILTVLVKKAGGEIRIDATEMLEESSGEGLSKRYDRDKKQLVLSFIPPGSEIFFNSSEEGDSQWQPNSNSHSSRGRSQRSSIVQPLQQSDLTVDYPSPPERMTSTIDDQRVADLEDHLRKEAAARILSNFPPTPITHPRGQPASRQKRVQPSFYRG
jgi:hypothetical protein